jgi:hypothetical protein
MADTNKDKQNDFEIVLEKSKTDVQSDPDPVAQTLNPVPTIFCADHNTAKALLVDIFALTGALRGISEGQVDPKTTSAVLTNGQRILSSLGDLLIRDCKLTETDINDVMRIFDTVEKTQSNTK